MSHSASHNLTDALQVGGDSFIVNGGSLGSQVYLLATQPTVRWTDVTSTIRPALEMESSQVTTIGPVLFSYGGRMRPALTYTNSSLKLANASGAPEGNAWSWRNNSYRHERIPVPAILTQAICLSFQCSFADWQYHTCPALYCV